MLTSDFKDILKYELSEYFGLFDKNMDTCSVNLPKIRFEKIDQYTFNVVFIILDGIERDI